MSGGRMYRGGGDRRGGDRDGFDPVAEGERFGLTPDVSREIWAHVQHRATHTDGEYHADDALRRFYRIAAKAARNGGRLRPEPGKVTLVESELRGHAGRDLLRSITPGKLPLLGSAPREHTPTGDARAPTASEQAAADVERLVGGLSFVESALAAFEEARRRKDFASAMQRATWLRDRCDGVVKCIAELAEIAARHPEHAEAVVRHRAEAVPLLARCELLLAPVPTLTADDTCALGMGWGALSAQGEAQREAWLASLGASEANASSPAARLDLSSSPVEVPHREQMEQTFGVSFAGVRAHVNEAAALAPHGARGAAMPGTVVFAAAEPDIETTAHELAHVRQLDQAGADVATPQRAWSVTWDAAEVEADTVAHAVARGAPSVRVSARPTAAVSFDTSPASETSTLSPAVEASIRALLDQPLSATDVSGIQARVRDLMTIFRAIPGDGARMALHERLATGTGELGTAFHTRLHRATQARLLGVLRGEPVPLPSRHDAMTAEGFAAHLPAEPFVVEPSPLAIHPRLSPQVTAKIMVRSPFGPPVDGPSATVTVRVFDPEGAEHDVDRAPWPSAVPTSTAVSFTFDRPGTYRIECDVVQGGLLVAQRSGAVTVTDPAEDIASGAGQRAAAGAWQAGAGVAGMAFAGAQARGMARPTADVAAAQQLGPEQLQQAHARMTAQLADATIDPAARAQIADDRNLIEFAAVGRGGDAALAIAKPPAPADRVTLWEYYRGALEVSADPAFLRHWVEQTFISGGMTAVEGLVSIVEQAAAGDHAALNGDPTARDFALGQVIPALQAQIGQVRADVRAFEREFGTKAEQLVRDTLDQSERIANQELARYGVQVSGGEETATDENGRSGTTPVLVRGGETKQADDMAKAAARLAANQREIDRMRTRLRELTVVQAYYDDLSDGFVTEFENAPDLANAPDETQLPAVLASLQRLVDAAEREHAQQIAIDTSTYPLLANYKRAQDDGRVDMDSDGLERLQSVGGRAQEIYNRVAPVLTNIETLRGALGKDFSVWREPRVVQMTMARLAVAPGTFRGAIVAAKENDAREGSWTDWAILALTVGLALLAAIPTGGSSVTAAVVATAAIADATLSVYFLVDHLQQYRIEEAATGTDLDAKARAISAQHPSFFWLAVDIVATMVGLPGAARTAMKAAADTFGTVARDLARAEELANTGGKLTAAEADLATARIHRYAREGKLSTDAAEQASGIIRRSTALDDAGDLAANAGRLDQRARVTAEQLGDLEARLGVRVEFDDALQNGVEVRYEAKAARLGLGTDIEPTVVRVGRAATIEDVLAHRTTVERITRYNGVTGKLRGLWDRFVVGADGGVNPFTKGTRSWESFEELRKVDSLIALRRARWNPKSLDATILDEEIAFLEGRRTHYEEILRSAEETGTIKGIGHIGQPDVNKVTEEALARGYKLPGPDEGVQSEWYYYRSKADAPGEYELALRDTAPSDAKTFRSVTKGGEFNRLVATGVTPRTFGLTRIADDQELIELWNQSMRAAASAPKDNGYKRYLQMLEAGQQPTPKQVRAAFDSVRERFVDAARGAGHDFADVHHWNWPMKDYSQQAIDARNLTPIPDDAPDLHRQVHATTSEGPHPYNNPIAAENVIVIENFATVLKKEPTP